MYAAAGGVHLFAADDRTLEWIGDHLRALTVQQLLVAHCTGIEAMHDLQRRLGLDRKTRVVGAVGACFDLKHRIRRGTIARRATRGSARPVLALKQSVEALGRGAVLG